MKYFDWAPSFRSRVYDHYSGKNGSRQAGLGQWLRTSILFASSRNSQNWKPQSSPSPTHLLQPGNTFLILVHVLLYRPQSFNNHSSLVKQHRVLRKATNQPNQRFKLLKTYSEWAQIQVFQSHKLHTIFISSPIFPKRPLAGHHTCTLYGNEEAKAVKVMSMFS